MEPSELKSRSNEGLEKAAKEKLMNAANNLISSEFKKINYKKLSLLNIFDNIFSGMFEEFVNLAPSAQDETQRDFLNLFIIYYC